MGVMCEPLRACRAAALAAALLAGAPAAGQEDRTAPRTGGGFEPTRLWKVRLTIPAKEFAAMLPRSSGLPGFGVFSRGKLPDLPDGSPREAHRNMFGMDLPWAVGSAAIDGETFDNVGIRYKGNGTISDASRTIKKSIKIDLDRFGGTGRHHGRKTVNLNCGVADPSKCRETLGYALYRAAGVPAPRTALAEVRLRVPGKYEDELLGVYTALEPVDKPFLREHFGNDKGLLMKPNGLREFEDQGDDWERYKKQYLPRRDATADEARRVIAFARLVHKADDARFAREIDSFLDVDAYLRFLAVTAFVANPDSFFVLGHNYYLYLHPRTERLHFIPWDLDRAFANLPVLGSNNQQMNLSLTRPYRGSHRLTDRLLALPGVSARYQKLLKELAAGPFEKGRLLKQLESYEAATKGLLARETAAAAARKEGGAGPTAMFGKAPPLRTFIEKRTASMAAQLAGKSRGFVPAGDAGGFPFRMGDVLLGPLLEALDADRDEKLSRAEWAAAARKVHAAAEKEAPKQVTEKALAAALNGLFPKPPEGTPPGFGPGNFMAGPIFRRADADKDGKVTRDELLAAAEKLFDEFDRAKSGSLDEDAFGELLHALFPPPKFGPGAKKDAGAEKKAP